VADITITDATTAAAVAAASNQSAQLAALAAPFVADGIVLTRTFAGSTQLDDAEYAPWVMDAAAPRGMSLGVQGSYSGYATATPTEVRFLNGQLLEIFRMPASVGGAGVSFTAGVMPSNAQANLSDAVSTKMRITANPSLPVSGVPAWLAGKAVNEWVSISGTNLSSVQPNPLPNTPGGTSAPASKITAWCGAALKRSTAEYIIGMSGGHADYAGSETDALRLSDDAPAWREVTPRSPDNTLYNQTAFNSDLSGAATHTYQYSQFLDTLDVYVSFTNPGTYYAVSSTNRPITAPSDWPYLGVGGPTGAPASVWSPAIDWTNGSYKSPTYIEPFPTEAGDWIAGLCVKHPTTSDVYIGRSGDRWRKFTAATRTWSTPSAVYETNYCGAAIDPTRSRMLIVGGYLGDVDPRVRDLDGNTVSVTFGGLGGSVLRAAEFYYAGVVYDEANDRYLAIKNGSTISVYAVNASTWAVSLLTTTGTAPGQRTNGIQNSAQYVPNLGGRSGVVIANTYTGNVFFLRTG
jgi:hypothetical protein